jgi:hypothetical protein
MDGATVLNLMFGTIIILLISIPFGILAFYIYDCLKDRRKRK